MANYQITGECAHVLVDSPTGPTTVLLYKGAPVPPNVSPERIKHLLYSGLIKEVGDDPAQTPVAPNSPLTPQAAGTDKDPDPAAKPEPDPENDTPAEAPAEADDVTARRAAAREKVTALGGKAPDGRASHDVLVEYLAGQGGSYDDLAKATKPELLEMVRTRS